MELKLRIVSFAFQILCLVLCARCSDPYDAEVETDLKIPDNSTPNRDFRWSYFYFLEKKCTKICKGHGKPFGRMQGALCRCYCPIVAPDWTLCGGTTPSCDNFCRAIKFRLGGGCIHSPDECYCFCYAQEFYNASKIYHMPPSPPKPFSLPFPFNHVKPTVNHIIDKINNPPGYETNYVASNTPFLGVGGLSGGLGGGFGGGLGGLSGYAGIFPGGAQIQLGVPLGSVPAGASTGITAQINSLDDGKNTNSNSTVIHVFIEDSLNNTAASGIDDYADAEQEFDIDAFDSNFDSDTDPYYSDESYPDEPKPEPLNTTGCLICTLTNASEVISNIITFDPLNPDSNATLLNNGSIHSVTGEMVAVATDIKDEFYQTEEDFENFEQDVEYDITENENENNNEESGQDSEYYYYEDKKKLIKKSKVVNKQHTK